MNIVLLGPPGAGKGTQAKRLQALTGLPHISSGDLFRAMALDGSPLGREVAAHLNSGKYVPDDLTIQVVLDRLSEPDASVGFLLDGFPRTQAQAEALDSALARKGQRVDAALYITAPKEVLVERLSGRIICPQCNAIYNDTTKRPRRQMVCDVCGHALERRQDEAPDVVRTRLETYIRETAPLADHYRHRGVLTEVDGSLPIEDVEQGVDAAVGLRGGVQ